MDFVIDEDRIDSAINSAFIAKREGENPFNTISEIHPQIAFYYNSFNVCLGKQGTGKTTFLLKQLMKLSMIPNQPYTRIIYITNGSGTDVTFEKIKQMIAIPIFGLSFENSTSQLADFFSSQENTLDHTFLIIEDASFMLLKDSPMWTEWVCKLRHLRLTIWVNLHIWRSLNSMLKTQITSVFIFKGFSREQMMQISRQSSSTVEFKITFFLYGQLKNRQLLQINNVNGKIEIIS